MSVNIKYKNNSIATLTDTGTKTLKTSGKYCEADIIVENTKDGGGGSNDLFHAEITPATSGEVLTLEVGEIGERIAGMIVSIKLGDTVEVGKNYGISYIMTVNDSPITARPDIDNLVVYRSANATLSKSDASTQYSNSVPSGGYTSSSYNIWNSTNVKPWVKFYVTNGAESKYGLLVGKTYDIWVIKD